MFKLLFWLALIGGGIFVGAQVIPVYYNNLRIENIFEGVAQNMNDKPENEVRGRITELLVIQSVDFKILPDDFIQNIVVNNENGKLQVSSEYHVVLWLLGKPQSVGPEEEYKESDVKPMDKIRLRARMDFDFAPSKQTP